MRALIRLILVPFNGLLQMGVGFLMSIPLLIIAAVFCINTWFPSVIKYKIDKKTHFAVNMEKVESDLFNGTCTFSNISASNSFLFPVQEFLTISAIEIAFNPKTMLSGEKIIDKIKLEISNLSWVRNSKGQVNLNYFLDQMLSKDSNKGLCSKIFKRGMIKSLELSIQNVGIYDFYPQVPKALKRMIRYQKRLENVVFGDYAPSDVKYLSKRESFQILRDDFRSMDIEFMLSGL